MHWRGGEYSNSVLGASKIFIDSSDIFFPVWSKFSPTTIRHIPGPKACYRSLVSNLQDDLSSRASRFQFLKGFFILLQIPNTIYDWFANSLVQQIGDHVQLLSDRVHDEEVVLHVFCLAIRRFSL